MDAESIDDILLEAEDRMGKAVEFLESEFSGLRSGKASPALVENINAQYYGTSTRLRDMSNIATPEPRLITITPFDPSALADIEKAILEANIGITPMNDGRIIRVPIPELSEERRTELAKMAKKNAEEQRIAVRNIRREANDHIKVLLKAHTVTEDGSKDGLDSTQKLTDTYIKKIDAMLTAKETEIMSV
jgi:ribosome recycling factor